MKNQTKIEQGFYWAVIAIIGSGMALRILMFFQNRSLFIDEACLSSQIVKRPYSGMFENMEYQYVPPFFAVIVKGMTDVFSSNEFALRLIPLLASLLGLVFFYRLCRHFLANRYCILPLFLFSFGMPILQYATEVKQYSTDMLVTILLLLLSINWKVEDLDLKRAIAWALTGVVVVWFSMPGVFILFGVGIYHLFELYKQKKWNKVPFVLGPIFFWLLSFAIYYFALIRNDIGLDNLEDYHARFFLPLLPSSIADLNQIKNILLSFFQTAIGATTLEIGFGLISFLWALVYLGKRDFGKVLLFTLPILAAIFASGMKMYSLIPRLTLFFIPILILLIGIGQSRIFYRSTKVFKWVLILPLLIIMANQKGYPYFYQRFEIEELREVLYFVQEHRMDVDRAFLYTQGTHAYVYYSNFYENAEDLKIPNIQIEEWFEGPKDIELPKESGDRIWLIFSHASHEHIKPYLDYLADDFEISQRKELKGAQAILLLKN